MVEVTENKMVSRFESGWKCPRDHTAPQTNLFLTVSSPHHGRDSERMSLISSTLHQKQFHKKMKKNFRDFLSVSKSSGNQGDSKRPSSRPLDDGESFSLGIRHGINYYNEKFSTPNFGAIQKWMRSKVGKSFDSVLSEISEMCGKSKRGLKMKKYFLDCIWNDILEKNGKYFSKKTGNTWHPASIKGALFVGSDGRLEIVSKKYE